MKILFSRLVALSLCLTGSSGIQAQSPPPLPQTLAGALQQAGISPNNVAVFIAPAEGGTPVVNHRAQAAMNPASVMKVVTTYAALDLLGPTYTWNTTTWIDGPLENGVLKGNLILQGSGDPSLNLTRFSALLRALKARGLNRIEGDLVLDRKAIRGSDEGRDPGAFDNDPLRPYNVIPDALLVNLNAFAFSLVANTAARRVDVLAQTPMEGVRIDNRIELTTGYCGDWRERLNIGTRQEKNEIVISLTGRFSSACIEQTLYLSPLPSERYIEALFNPLWKELGGSLQGRVRSGEASPKARLFVENASPPLAETIRDINKYSNNPMARLLYLSLAKERPADAVSAENRLRTWLKSKKIDESRWVFENGAGLSRNERVSAEGLGLLLQDAWRSPLMPEFAASLPLQGMDGTLRSRSTSLSLLGRVRLKSGSINGVRAVAGYVLDKTNRWWILVALINDTKADGGAAIPFFTMLNEWVWKQGAP